MSRAAPRRVSFQQLGDQVYQHAAARGWPEVAYQAAFRTVVEATTDQRQFEGNSLFWNPEWNTDLGADHSVRVGSGEDAWRVFVESALYPDLLRAEEELQQS